jgi:hypothetical protein
LDEVAADAACRQLRSGGKANLDQTKFHQPRDGRARDLDRDTERCCYILDRARGTIEREQDHFFNRAPSPGATSPSCQRAAVDIEGHSAVRQIQPDGTIEREEIDVATDAGKFPGASRRADRHQTMRIPPVRIPVFLYFALSLSLKIVWVARSDKVQLPSAADSPRAQHRLRRELAVEVI